MDQLLKAEPITFMETTTSELVYASLLTLLLSLLLAIRALAPSDAMPLFMLMGGFFFGRIKVGGKRK